MNIEIQNPKKCFYVVLKFIKKQKLKISFFIQFFLLKLKFFIIYKISRTLDLNSTCRHFFLLFCYLLPYCILYCTLPRPPLVLYLSSSPSVFPFIFVLTSLLFSSLSFNLFYSLLLSPFLISPYPIFPFKF